MVVIDTKTYEDIVSFVKSQNVLSVDCEVLLHRKWPDIPRGTIGSILAQIGKECIKTSHHRIVNNAPRLLRDYDKEVAETGDHFILVKMSVRLQFSPISLIRVLLAERFKVNYSKTQIAEMVKNPNLIEDPVFACNVANCLYNDCFDGPLSDVISRCIGEEYEIRLKDFAREAGLIFYDENDLRRTGFDKTPDLKLAVPCLFRGTVIHWIESKALFGSYKIHQKYVKEQLSSYYNRFSAGIVIYWEGYQDSAADCRENNNLIIVTDAFPRKDEIGLLVF